MPTYSYACTECDNKFDAVQAFTDDALTSCPQCEGRLRKLFNSVGVVFKGSGFYRNDSREAGKKSESSTASGAKSEKAASSDSGSSGGASGGAASGTASSTASSSSAPAAASK